MTQRLTNAVLTAFASLIVFSHTSIALGQADIAWTGSGDGSSFSDDNNWFATEAGGSGIAGPEILFTTDSLKFDTAPGVTINNDLGDGLVLGSGFNGTEANSGSFHFMAGSGDFTFTGNPITVGDSGSSHTVVRAEVGAGTTQTFDVDLILGSNLRRRKVALLNNGTAIFNGNISFANSRIFIDEAPGRVEINGDNIGVGSGSVSGGTNGSRATVRVNSSAANTVLHLGSDTALGDAGFGSWDAGDLQMRGLTANGITVLETDAPRDYSGYFVALSNASGGGAIRFNSPHDISIGYLSRAGNGTRVVSATNTGVVTVENGIFVSTNDVAQTVGVFAGGTVGNVVGGNGHIVFNGRLHTTLIDPATAVSNGTSATGGINPASQGTAIDGVTPINGTLNARFGRTTLNADSTSSWIGGQVLANNGGIILVGNDNAFGDSTSIVGLQGTGIVDIGTHTVEQRFIIDGGTLRGNGTLTNEADWSVSGTVQPGGEIPTATDTLTFDFTNNSVGNTLQFEAASTLDFVLDGGLASSTLDVFGPSLGGTTDIVFDGSTFSFTDISGSSLTEGTYTLVDGDANTSITLGGGTTLTGLEAFPGSSLSVSGDDLILNLTSSGPSGNADFNADGDVDGGDFLTWQQNVGFTAPIDLQPFGDANSDDSIDQADLTVWGAQYGTLPALSAAATVPEPAALALLLVGISGCVVTRRTR